MKLPNYLVCVSNETRSTVDEIDIPFIFFWKANAKVQFLIDKTNGAKFVLKDKKTNKLLSEYISFDEAPRKGHSDAGYAKWNCLNLNTLADNANGYDVSDIYQFFFSHAVENNEMVENQR